MSVATSYDRRIRRCIVAALFLLLMALIPGLRGFWFDTGCWAGWTSYIGTHGLSQAYESGTNYPPLYQYVMWAFARLVGDEAGIRAHIGYLRAFTLLADFWGLWLVYLWTGRKTDYIIILFLSVLNIGYSYNTLIWGQIDGIVATLTFAAFYFQWKARPVLSGILMLLALNTKLQAIVFLPLWGVLFLHSMLKTRSWRGFGLTLLAMACMQVAILIPFGITSGGLQKIVQVLQDNFSMYPFTTVHAANMWYWIVSIAEPGPDTVVFFAGMTYRQIGLLLFCITAILAFIPLLRAIMQSLKQGTNVSAALSPEVIWLTAALLPLLAFFFTTQMHERYAHGAAIFLAAYAFRTKRWLEYILFSIAYFLNLEWVMQWLGLSNYGTLIFDPRFAAGLFALVIGLLFYQLYHGFFIRGKQLIVQAS